MTPRRRSHAPEPEAPADDSRQRIDDFVAAATTFREVCESAGRGKHKETLRDLASALPRLQAAAARLPEVEPTLDHPVFSADDRKGEGVPEGLARVVAGVDWSVVQSRLAENVDGGDSFAAAPAFVADGLYSVYLDVKEGFDVIEAGYPEQEAVWEWRFGFWTHWGAHAAEVQRVIHYYVVEQALW